MECPICVSDKTEFYQNVDEYSYYECTECQSIILEKSIIDDIDKGLNIRKYNEQYWQSELAASKKRSYGPSIARMAEVIHYLQIPMNVFLDIGTGPGYLLDAVTTYLPKSSNRFYGIEKFPPLKKYQTKHKNYIIGNIKEITHKVDCGVCIEVIEHITPKMLTGLLSELSSVSNPGAVYLFNSGQPKFVKNEDPKYLDPTKRGHIVSYSVKAMSLLAAPHGFNVHELPGKSWAMVLEYKPSHGRCDMPIQNRIWYALSENVDLLNDFSDGSIIKILGLESARAYY
jgi:hypothetical protein